MGDGPRTEDLKLAHEQTLPLAGASPCPRLATLLAAAAAPDEDPASTHHLDGCASCRDLALGARRRAAELAPAQVGRDCDAIEAMLADLDDGGRLEQDGQAVLFVHFVGCESCRAFVQPLEQESPDTSDPSRLPAEPASALPIIARSTYRYEEELARGGMGRISRAVDRRLGRAVAIKEVIPDGERSYAETHAWNARLEREARITARLNHPSIVSVHEAGLWPRGTPFFAMDLVAGRSLDRVLAECETLKARLALLPHVIAAADALAYAHSENVIHRDLKPGNVLVGRYGETVVIDWGLAKDLGDGAADVSSPGRALDPILTQAGATVGTPAYMPPEQAEGLPVGRSADVYSLGALLYHLLAGRPPYAELGGREMLAAARERPPRPVGELVDGVPAALATIVAKAMDRDPASRYPSAAELAEDLRRFQTGRLVQAHDYAAVELVRHWFAHRRVSVALAVGLAALLLVTAVTGVGGILGQRDRATAAAARAERTSERLILAGARALIARDPTAAVAWLRRLPITRDNWLDVHAVAGEAEGAGIAGAVLENHTADVEDLRTSPDGRLAFSGDTAGELRVWDLAGGGVRVLGHDGAGISEVALSPDGRSLAVAGLRGLGVYDLATGARRDLPGHRGAVYTVGYAAGGRELVTGGADGSVRRFALDTGAGRVIFTAEGAGEPKPLHEILRTPRDATHVFSFHAASRDVTVVFTGGGEVLALGPDGTPRWRAEHPGGMPSAYALSRRDDELATVGQDHQVRRWRIDSGQVEVVGGGEDLLRIEYSPDGRWLAASARGPIVHVWDLAGARGHELRGHRLSTYRVAFSRDGSMLASAGHDGTVRVWAPDQGELWTLRGHRSAVKWLAWGEGDALLSLASDGTGRLWHPASRATRTLPGHAALINRVRFAAGAPVAATAGLDGAVRLWDLTTLAHRTLEHELGVRNAWLSSDGTKVISTDAGYTCRLWTGGSGRVIGGRGECATAAAFAPGGGAIVTLDRDRKMRTWSVADGTTPTATREDVAAMAVAPGGDLMVLTAAGVILRQGSDGSATELGRTPAPVIASWAADGSAVLVAADDQYTLVDVTRGARRSIPLPEGPCMWQLAPDGRIFAVGDLRGRLHVFDTATGAARVLTGHTGRVVALALSRGGRWAASASEGELLLWDLETGRYRRLHGHPEWVNDLAFSPDGTQLMSAGTDGTIRLWSAELAAPLPRSPAEVERDLARATSAVLGDDDDLRVVRATR